MKKIIAMLLAISILLPLNNIKIMAMDNEPLSIKFSKFEFVTNDYNPRDVIVEYKNEGMKEKAYIISRYNGEILEIMTDIRSGERSKYTSPHTFVRSVRCGDATVEFYITVDLYSQGSFRQINSYRHGQIFIKDGASNFRLENPSHSVWSPNGFPTVELHYVFSGTLCAEIDTTVDASVSANLEIIGFSVGESIGNKVYYRKNFNSSGIINIYG